LYQCIEQEILGKSLDIKLLLRDQSLTEDSGERGIGSPLRGSGFHPAVAGTGAQNGVAVLSNGDSHPDLPSRTNKKPGTGPGSRLQVRSKGCSKLGKGLAHRCAARGSTPPLQAPAPKTALPFCRTGVLIQTSRHGQIKNPAQGRVFYLWR